MSSAGAAPGGMGTKEVVFIGGAVLGRRTGGVKGGGGGGDGYEGGGLGWGVGQ